VLLNPPHAHLHESASATRVHIYCDLVKYLTKLVHSKKRRALCPSHRRLPPRHRTPPSIHHHRAHLQTCIKTRSTPMPNGSCKNMAAQASGSSPHKSRRTSFRTPKFLSPCPRFGLKTDVPPQRPLGSIQARDCLLRAFWFHQVVRHHQPPLTRSIRSPSTRSAEGVRGPSGRVPCGLWDSVTPYNFLGLSGLPHRLT
jgi:hypothetical protein